jgi:hypothetical protein
MAESFAQPGRLLHSGPADRTCALLSRLLREDWVQTLQEVGDVSISFTSLGEEMGHTLPPLALH